MTRVNTKLVLRKTTSNNVVILLAAIEKHFANNH